MKSAINADVALGNQEHINETPTMVIVFHGKRERILGYVGSAILKAYFDQKLA